MIGYRSGTVKEVRVLADQTHGVDFDLTPTVLELPGQEVVGERNPLFVRDNTVSKERLGSRVGRLDDEDMVRLNRAILVFLGMAGSSRT